ncbi:MAG: cation transporter [Chloroflexaceae bacterium]|nr:cation transporter [Chloroflexaceae bacterium]
MTVSKQFAALLSILLGIVLTAIKFSIAIVTGSLSVLAEAVDAILDLVATGVTFLAVRVADLRPTTTTPMGTPAPTIWGRWQKRCCWLLRRCGLAGRR